MSKLSHLGLFTAVGAIAAMLMVLLVSPYLFSAFRDALMWG
jgi:hypothetical protein